MFLPPDRTLDRRQGSKDMAEELGDWDKKSPVSGRTWCLGDTFKYLHGDERFFFFFSNDMYLLI